MMVVPTQASSGQSGGEHLFATNPLEVKSPLELTETNNQFTVHDHFRHGNFFAH